MGDGKVVRDLAVVRGIDQRKPVKTIDALVVADVDARESREPRRGLIESLQARLHGVVGALGGRRDDVLEPRPAEGKRVHHGRADGLVPVDIDSLRASAADQAAVLGPRIRIKQSPLIKCVTAEQPVALVDVVIHAAACLIRLNRRRRRKDVLRSGVWQGQERGE